jgi:hypothetical protein
MKKLCILFILLLCSCSTVHQTKRSPSSVDFEAGKSYFWKFYADYVVQHNVAVKKSDLLNNKEQFYRLMGAIANDREQFEFHYEDGKIEVLDIQHMANKQELHWGRDYPFAPRGKIKQIDYAEWNESLDDLIRLFMVGQYVVPYEDGLLGLWGEVITSESFSSIYQQRLYYFSEKLNWTQLQLMKHLLDGNKVIEHEGQVFSLPRYKRVRYGHMKRAFYLAHQKDKSLLRDMSNKEIPYWYQAFANGKFFYRDHEGVMKRVFRYDYTREFFWTKRKSLLGYEELHNNSCELNILVRPKNLNSKKFLAFVKSIEDNKFEIMEATGLTNNEYNHLASAALAVLIIESRAGKNVSYLWKEKLRIGSFNLGQFIISTGKKVEGRTDSNSRGLTRIKDFDKLVKGTSFEELGTADLNDPTNAAIATMLVLNEKYGYLKHFKGRHHNIDDDNWPNYLYYFYQGSSAQITKGAATPAINMNIRIFKKMLKEVIFLEKCY